MSSFLPCLITQVCCIFISNAKFDGYESTRVQIGNEHVTVTYHAAVAKNWNKTIADEDMYAFRTIQEEEDDPFFDEDPPMDPNKHLNIVSGKTNRAW